MLDIYGRVYICKGFYFHESVVSSILWIHVCMIMLRRPKTDHLLLGTIIIKGGKIWPQNYAPWWLRYVISHMPVKRGATSHLLTEYTLHGIWGIRGI